MPLECTVLPSQHSEFARSSYWNTFFAKRGRRPFEWYGEYTDLVDIFNKYIRKFDPILVPGCGNSSLSECLYEMQGCQNITNVDTSSVVIRQMSTRNKHRKGMVFEQKDATNTGYGDGQFSVIVDKGTLDAIMYAPNEECLKQGRALLQEYSRVLKIGGRCIIISLVQDHILRLILDHFFVKEGWVVRFHRCISSEDKHILENPDGVVMPVFAVVATKFKRIQNFDTPPLEMTSVNDAPRKMHGGPQQLLQEIKKLQEFALYRHRVRRAKIEPMDEMMFVIEDDNGDVRYELRVVDNESEDSENGSIAVFIVPQGKEKVSLYATKEGRRELAKSAAYERLIVVLLQPHKFYEGIEGVKYELSKHVLALTGPTFLEGTQVPFLTEGTSVTGKIRCQGNGSKSGAFVIEESVHTTVSGTPDHLVRRLVFLSNQHMIQSEARLKLLYTPKTQPELDTALQSAFSGSGRLERSSEFLYEVDHTDLSCNHHIAIVGGLAYMPSKYFPDALLTVEEERRPKVLVIGLGGGCLPMYLRTNFPGLKIEVVEIDSTMLDVAKEWFGFREDENLRVIVDDGLKYIKELAACEESQGTYDAVVFDVNNSDASAGLSSPPMPFVDETVVSQVKKCLREGGIFILNLATRSESLKRTIQQRMAQWFDRVYVAPIDEEINEVLICIMNSDLKQEELVYEAKRKSLLNGEAAEENGEKEEPVPQKKETGKETEVQEYRKHQSFHVRGLPGVRVISSPSELERSLKFERILSNAKQEVHRLVVHLESRAAVEAADNAQFSAETTTTPEPATNPKPKKKSKSKKKKAQNGEGDKSDQKSDESPETSPEKEEPVKEEKKDEKELSGDEKKDEEQETSPTGAGKKKKNKKKKKKSSTYEVNEEVKGKGRDISILPSSILLDEDVTTKMEKIFDKLGLMGRDTAEHPPTFFPVTSFF